VSCPALIIIQGILSQGLRASLELLYLFSNFALNFRKPNRIAPQILPYKKNIELEGNFMFFVKLLMGYSINLRILTLRIRMATGRTRIGWSLWAPKTETRTENPNPPQTPIRVEIHPRNRNLRIPETRLDTRNLLCMAT
jgi:hypothetical protein